jgi:hypothetical protein
MNRLDRRRALAEAGRLYAPAISVSLPFPCQLPNADDKAASKLLIHNVFSPSREAFSQVERDFSLSAGKRGGILIALRRWERRSSEPVLRAEAA